MLLAPPVVVRLAPLVFALRSRLGPGACQIHRMSRRSTAWKRSAQRPALALIHLRDGDGNGAKIYRGAAGLSLYGEVCCTVVAAAISAAVASTITSGVAAAVSAGVTSTIAAAAVSAGSGSAATPSRSSITAAAAATGSASAATSACARTARAAAGTIAASPGTSTAARPTGAACAAGAACARWGRCGCVCACSAVAAVRGRGCSTARDQGDRKHKSEREAPQGGHGRTAPGRGLEPALRVQKRKPAQNDTE